MTTTWKSLHNATAEIAEEWRSQRADRQARRSLDKADFDRLRDAGLLLTGVPAAAGGLWESPAASTRNICEALRTLATADASVALVSSMHPSVLAFWLSQPDDAPAPFLEQRTGVCATAADGLQWGTITSEPGSGGDIAKTKTLARRTDDGTYLISGDKHFGSGSGVTSFMITTALPDDGEGPSVFFIDVRDRPWDGSAGLLLIAEWDGIGMAATQSHAMRLEDCPATRMAWDGAIEDITIGAAPVVANLFTSVVLGVFDEAIRTAKQQLAPRAAGLRAYEQVEWSRAELDHWVAVQAYEGALRAVETGPHLAAVSAALRAKEAVAELAESSLSRISRVIGGGTFSRRSPFASWAEDVRALGFLRPPWGLAYDSLFGTSFAD